jgi:hypothetical protein
LERFYGVSKVYKSVAEDTELDNETPDKRVRGTTIEDVVELISLGLQKKEGKAMNIIKPYQMKCAQVVMTETRNEQIFCYIDYRVRQVTLTQTFKSIC